MSDSSAERAPGKDGQGTPHPRVRLFVEVLCAAVGLALLVWAWRADQSWFEVHTMGYFSCMTSPGEIRNAVIKRWLGVVAGLVVLFVVRPRAGRWAGADKSECGLHA